MFNLTLVGDAKLVARLRSLPVEVNKAIRAKVEALTIQLQAHIVRDKLSGQVLGVVSGDLRRSIQRKIEATEQAVFGVVYSAGDVKYAAAHEYGFDGEVTVKQHMRTMVFGKEAAVAFAVGPFQRHMKLPARSFMRSSLEDMREQITAGLKEAVVATAQGRSPA